MLRFAPSPMPDELLYSYVARWFFRSGYATENIFNVAAFDRQIAHEALNAYRHTRLNWRGGEILPPDQVADSMSLLPYARVFIGAVDYARHLDPLSPAGDPAAPPKALCQPPWRPTELRYCATCMRQQVQDTGAAFWRRTHNLPGVAACTSHGEHLISIAIRRGELAVVPWTPDVESAQASEAEMWFATQSELLLNANLPVIHMKQWEAAIRAGINQRFGKSRRMDLRQQVRVALEQTFDKDFLRRIEVPELGGFPTALDRLFEPGLHDVQPTFAILLARLLWDGGIAELLEHAMKVTVEHVTPAHLEKIDKKAKRERFKTETRLALQRAIKQRREKLAAEAAASYGHEPVFINSLD